MLMAGSARAQTALANGASQAWTLILNTTIAYTFAANAGDNIVLRLGSSGFSGRLDLDGPTGALVKSAGGNSTDWPLA